MEDTSYNQNPVYNGVVDNYRDNRRVFRDSHCINQKRVHSRMEEGNRRIDQKSVHTNTDCSRQRHGVCSRSIDERASIHLRNTAGGNVYGNGSHATSVARQSARRSAATDTGVTAADTGAKRQKHQVDGFMFAQKVLKKNGALS